MKKYGRSFIWLINRRNQNGKDVYPKINKISFYCLENSEI